MFVVIPWPNQPCFTFRGRELSTFNFQLSLEDIVRDSWHWQSQNPSGYKT
jgi:hypothetical protein